MNIFKRILKIGQAEIHALVDKMEDPISLTEQGIRDMKIQLAETTEALAKVKATLLRSQKEIQEKEDAIKNYEDKARLILTKAQQGELEIPLAEKLAGEALLLKKQASEDQYRQQGESKEHTQKLEEVNAHLEILKYNISKWEKELTTLKAKKRVHEAASLANQQMANIETNSTLDMLQRIKRKVENDEALAEAYAEIAKSNAPAPNVQEIVQEELTAMKKQLGLD
ncbi:PspA/IM30 family protein [Sphingobacterium sp. LRF_L2]|uniref:PspA/IM30 family protein n=1 Tax=Sphingobacterium sp. LRF_L2 TaxID=3369421 RepID=UPI003F60E07F